MKHLQKFFEYSEKETIYKGDETRSKLGGRSEVVEMDIDDSSISVKYRDAVLEKYVSWYDRLALTPLYRGIKTFGKARTDEYLIVDPSKHERVAVDTDNYYNLIIDNDKKWSKFPKRSESIIGTTEKERAFRYGTVYRVIPLFENSQIAVAPNSDIWWSFGKWFRTHNPMYTTCHVCSGAGDVPHPAGGETACSFCEATGTIEVTSLNDFNFKLKNDFKLDKDNYTWKEFKKKIGSAMPQISEIFDPKYNGFKIDSYNNNTDIEGSKEFWTDAKCLLIREDLFY